MKEIFFAVEHDALNGEGKAWAVEDKNGYIVYESMFNEATATALARLCTSMPKANWKRHCQILEKDGYDLADPALTSGFVGE